MRRATTDSFIPIIGRKAVIVSPGAARGRFLMSPSARPAVLCAQQTADNNLPADKGAAF